MRLSLIEMSNNDKMTTTMLMPDDLCGVINSYLKPEWKRLVVGIKYDYDWRDIKDNKVKYFVEADYVKAREYYDDQLEKLIDDCDEATIIFQFHEYINGEWKFSKKYEDLVEIIYKCDCCQVIGNINGDDLVDCEGCGVVVYCSDCAKGGYYNDDWHCADCLHQYTSSDEED